MKTDKHVLLLIGSPKSSKSTSESLSNYLIDQLQTRGLSTEKIHIGKSLRNSEGLSSLLLALDGADTVVLASPLYVDSLPYPVTRALEAIAEYRHGKELKKKQSLIAI
ncbi:MAG: hypothetical protein IBX64_13065 [Actinobacteria bacterium]|nr:hypothetical protein [Actinomycetota bacterium]